MAPHVAVGKRAVKRSSRWQQPDQAAQPAWPTHLVIVLATYTGTLTLPDQRRSKTWRTQHDPRNWLRNTSNLTFVIYQRQNASMPNYSPNFGFEAGVIVQFVLTHYAALPNLTLFMQDRPEQHNPQWMAWLECLRPNVSYAPLVNARMVRLYKANAQTDDGTEREDAIVEQCWRTLLDAWHVPLLLPREQPTLTYFQGSTFVVSRDKLRATPLSTWRRAHALLAGGDGRCFTGRVQWERLSLVRSKRKSLEYDSPDARGKHTSANAFEALQHILVGGFGREDVFTYDYCAAYVPDCASSPCGRVRRMPKAHTQVLGRIDFERRRLVREYLKLLRGLRRVANVSIASREARDTLPTKEPGGGGEKARGDGKVARVQAASGTLVERTFWQEFGWALGGE